MDFFEHQDVARRKTSLLILYFLIAVGLIVMAVYCAAASIFIATQTKPQGPQGPTAVPGFWNPPLLVWVAGGTLLVILLGSLYKMAALKDGGEVVARLLGGRLVNPNTQDLDERVLLNVVEEMAIASGTPVPPVFLLDDERGINAFAAGFSPGNAVIGVTRGTVETLTRDELQGVIAHEFSHILNGDMRLNIRLMGVLHGILVIALIGYGILRGLQTVRVSRDSKKGGAGFIIALLALGVALLVIGYVGVFFGKLIKSALSRQREFLADASAVQFTRQPGGIAGALKRIGGLTAGSRVGHAQAESASHMFFGNAVRESFFNLMSTHPPLVDRIQRIEPTFDGTFPEVTRVVRTARDLHREERGAVREKAAEAIRARSGPEAKAAAGASAFAFQPAEAVGTVGAPTSEHVTYAAALVSTLPADLVTTVREPLGAVATIYALLLGDDEQVRQAQLRYLQEQPEQRAFQETRRTVPLIAAIGHEARLPLVEMTLPALCQLSPTQYRDVRDTIRQLIESDRKVTLFEYALQRMLLCHLAHRFERVKPLRIRFSALRPLLPSCAALLSALAYVGQRDQSAATRAFSAGADRLATPAGTIEMLPREQADLRMVDRALDSLAAASPQIKKRVLEACAACIGADGRVTVEEAELLRVIADSLHCPMPPLLAGQGV